MICLQGCFSPQCLCVSVLINEIMISISKICHVFSWLALVTFNFTFTVAIIYHACIIASSHNAEFLSFCILYQFDVFISERMNLSRGQQLFEEMRKKWFQNKVIDMTNMAYYFKVNGSCPISPTNFIFIGYVQPPISLIYLLFLIFTIYIFAKEKMFGFLQVIIVLSNILIVIPLFLVAPIIVVFFHFADISEPMPYPWCSMYMMLDITVPKTTRTVVLYLKILLSINRVCSVYYPFQTMRWFTKRKIALYCILVLALCFSTSGYVYFNTLPAVEPYFGTVWPNGDIATYYACSLRPFEFHGSDRVHTVILPFIDSAVNVMGFILLIVFNVIFIIKLKKKQKERRILKGEVIPKHTKKTENRIDRMNTISGYILYVLVFIEIPRFIKEIISFQEFARVDEIMNRKTYSETSQCVDNIIDILERIVMTCTLSLDLIIFLAISTKMKNAIKQRICACNWCPCNDSIYFVHLYDDLLIV